MGPRLFRRGNRKRKITSWPQSMLQWGHVFSDVEIQFRELSGEKTSLLQWGHVFSDVEIIGFLTRSRMRLRRFNGATSFQTWKLETKKPSCLVIVIASMGPRLFRRGNRIYVSTSRRGRISLQWGHVFSDVEMTNYASPVNNGMTLQWGHVFSDVEMFVVPPENQGQTVASMGPRLFRRGNTPACLRSARSGSCFNGATSFQTWK